jgi:hypothetical protein
MMKSANFCDCYDRAIFHDLALNRALFAERQMWAGETIHRSEGFKMQVGKMIRTGRARTLPLCRHAAR